ncbi:MAG: hypothetical protein ACXV0U_02045 [Kineosporiaceae bacterium]
MRPGFVVRPAGEQHLDAAGAVARAAYEAEHLVGEHYLATIGDARARAREAVVAVAVDPARPIPNGASGVLGPVVGSVTFVLPGSRWADLAGEGQAEFRMLGPPCQRRTASMPPSGSPGGRIWTGRPTRVSTSSASGSSSTRAPDGLRVL